MLPKFIGHRGIMGYSLENTISSFTLAKALGIKWVEFDVKKTKDNKLIIFHDETLDRLCGNNRRIIDMNLIDVLKVSLPYKNNYYKIPIWEEAITTLDKLGLQANIEIKPCSGTDEVLAELVARSISSYWPGSLPPLISSFSVEALETCHHINPLLKLGYLIEEIPSDLDYIIKKTNCQSLHVNEGILTDQNIKMLLAYKLPLVAYTVNCKIRSDELFRKGISSIVTDRLF